MTTGPFAVRSDSLTGLPSVPFSAKSGAFWPTSSATAALARTRTARALRTRHRLTARVLGIAPPWTLIGKLPDPTAGSACEVLAFPLSGAIFSRESSARPANGPGRGGWLLADRLLEKRRRA